LAVQNVSFLGGCKKFALVTEHTENELPICGDAYLFVKFDYIFCVCFYSSTNPQLVIIL